MLHVSAFANGRFHRSAAGCRKKKRGVLGSAEFNIILTLRRGLSFRSPRVIAVIMAHFLSLDAAIETRFSYKAYRISAGE